MADYVDMNNADCFTTACRKRRLKRRYAAQGYELRPAVDEGDVRGGLKRPGGNIGRFRSIMAKGGENAEVVAKQRSPQSATCKFVGAAWEAAEWRAEWSDDFALTEGAKPKKKAQTIPRICRYSK